MRLHEKNGHCNVTTCNKDDDKILGRWVKKQRSRKSKGSLQQDRIDRLEKLNFVWDRHQDQWEDRYAQLRAFHRKHGHCNLPKSNKKNKEEQRLEVWVSKQRMRRKGRILPQDRIERLDEIGFVWERLEESWDHKYGQLCAFKSKYGHCNVPFSRSKANGEEFEGLGTWVQRQRAAKKRTKTGFLFPPDRLARLEEIGFLWDARDVIWNEKFQELKKFREDHGHCNVPRENKGNTKLRTWLKTQRTICNQGKMRSDRKAKLISIDFDGSGMIDQPVTKTGDEKEELSTGTLQCQTQQQWNESFGNLVEFKYNHGHWRVPHLYEKDTSLAQWIETQREIRDTMKPGRLKLLDSVGFPWDRFDIDQSNKTEARGQVASSDSEYETADEEMPVEKSSGTTSCDEKPPARKSAEYPEGTHVRKVKKWALVRLYRCAIGSLTLSASLIL